MRDDRSKRRGRSFAMSLAALLGVAVVAWLQGYSETGGTGGEWTAVEEDSGRMLEIEGRVVRLLEDDREGDRHQRFIVELGSGATLLVAHNIDIAPRVPVAEGDSVALRGQYEWNERGGVVHWTHHDPRGRRSDTGWIRHDDALYE